MRETQRMNQEEAALVGVGQLDEAKSMFKKRTGVGSYSAKQEVARIKLASKRQKTNIMPNAGPSDDAFYDDILTGED